MRQFGLSGVIVAVLAVPASADYAPPAPASYPSMTNWPAFAPGSALPGYAPASATGEAHPGMLPPYDPGAGQPGAAPGAWQPPAPGCTDCGFALDPCQPQNYAHPPKVAGEYWARVDWLYWRFRSAPVPPLAFTGDPNGNAAAIPGSGNATPLVGPSHDLGMFSGVRVTVGEWLDPDGELGAEVGGFIFQRRGTSDVIAGAPTRPVSVPFATAAGDVGVYDFSYPGRTAGGVMVNTASQLLGAEANLLHRWYSRNGVSIDGLAGYRYLWLNERLDLFGRVTPTGVVGTFAGAALPAGAAVFTTDSFRANTQFHGGQVGFRAEARRGMFVVAGYEKYGLGANLQTLHIDGTTSATGAGTAIGGVRAVPGNVGSYTRTEFAMMNEAGIEIGLQVTNRFSLRVGYTALWWSNVLRPGGVGTPLPPASQVPIDPGYNPAAAARLPVQLRSSDFLAHGLVVGALYEW